MTAAFSLLNAQGQITTEAGIGASPAEDEFSLPVDLTSGFDTGPALFNPGNATANLTLQFIAEDGSTAEAEFPLEARSTAAIEPQGAGLSLGPLTAGAGAPIRAFSSGSELSPRRRRRTRA